MSEFCHYNLHSLDLVTSDIPIKKILEATQQNAVAGRARVGQNSDVLKRVCRVRTAIEFNKVTSGILYAK